MTPAKSWFTEKRQPAPRIRLRKLRDGRNPSRSKIARGSGHHQVMAGTDDHGKMPMRYARKRLSGSSVPPTATRPFGISSSTSSGWSSGSATPSLWRRCGARIKPRGGRVRYLHDPQGRPIGIEAPQHRHGDVVNRNAVAGVALGLARVRVSVEGHTHPVAVERFLETARSE